MDKKAVFFLTFLAMLLIFSSCRRPASSSVNIIGSTTVTPLMERLVAVYEEDKEHRFDIQSLGSTMGVNSVRDGHTPIGMSSRSLTDEERTKGVIAHQIAIEALAVAVNYDNPIDSLSHQQIHDIFSGKITNWNQVGGFDRPIVVISREAGSGARATFEALLKLQENKESLIDSIKLLIIGDGTGQVRANVASKIEGIGYMSVAVVDGQRVKAIRIDGYAPTMENIQQGLYLLSEPLYLLTRADSPREITQFLEWILSPAGQAVVVEFGAVPVRMP